MEPLPIKHSSPSQAAWTAQLWPMVAPGPTSTPRVPLTWTTAQSCTLAPRRTMIGVEVGADDGVVPDRRALSTVTSPTRTAVGAMNAGWMHARRFPFEAEQWHEVVPRSMLKSARILVRADDQR